MSNLLDHAEYELRQAGMFDEDADYGGALGHAVLELIRVFAEQGHSGFSASITITLFEKLARFQPLTDITSNPDEWTEVGTEKDGITKIYQNKRRASSFSRDGGKTWYDIEDATLNNGDVWRK